MIINCFPYTELVGFEEAIDETVKSDRPSGLVKVELPNLNIWITWDKKGADVYAQEAKNS